MFAADVQSNIVGYSTIGNALEEGGVGKNIGIGGLFVPVAGVNTFKLGEISVKGEYEDGECVDPFDPEGEYIQELSPNGSKTIGRYTCLTKEYLQYLDMYEDFKDYIGWWDVTDQSLNFFEEVITNPDLKADGKDITVGTAFLGAISSHDRSFTSAGSVPLESTAFANDNNKNPFFLNYLPVEITLGQTEMVGEFEEEECVDPFDPEGEYLQVLAPNGSKTIARYTYLSKDYLQYLDMYEDFKDYIGWWDVTDQSLNFFEEVITNPDLNANSVKLAPGFSFLGALSSHDRAMRFPSALDKAE